MTWRRPSRKGLIFLAAFVALAGGTGVYLAYRARHMDNAIREKVVRALSDHFHSRVELASLHVAPFPELNVTGHDLTIYFDDRSDLPPLIRVDKFTFSLHWTAIWKLPRHISSAQVENMTITVPPRGERSTAPGQKKSARDQLLSWVIDHVNCTNTVLITLPKKAEPGKPQKQPHEWAIHNLDLWDAGLGEPFRFTGTLTNAEPKGEIATSGYFGPWDVDEPGGTPVSGKYTFTDADLGPFPGIAGILSSNGKYDGEIDKLEVNGETDTPDFSLDKIGKPVPLHTEYSATVDGTNGDTFLHPVRATLVRSLISAQGEVVSEPPKKGKKIALTFSAPDARIQDVLSLAVNSKKPFLSGPANLKGKLVIPQGNQKVLERMVLDAQIGVEEGQWTSAAVREKLESLSRHGEGKPSDEDAGSAVSNLYGRFHLENGVVNFSSVSFSVPGASIDLAGTYKLVSGEIDMKGHLKLQAELSQTTTGAKSFFLKVLDPFFKKDGAGTEIPITITGTRDKPDIGVTILHKKIEKKLGGSNSSQK
jgi:VCBS repeat-containing protein